MNQMHAMSLSRGQSAAAALQPVGRLVVAPASSMDLNARADEAATLLKALANPDRLLLLCQLVDGELSVNALGQLAGIEQPSLSQQLGVLRRERLVATRRDGKNVHYRIASPAALAVLQTLYGLYCVPATSPAPKRKRKETT